MAFHDACQSDADVRGRQQRATVELFCRTDGVAAVRRLRASVRATCCFRRATRRFPFPPNLGRHDLAITATDRVGNYRVQAGGSHGVDLGFSVNYAPEQTRLDRLTDQELTEMFGPVKFRLAHTRQQIDRDISVGRVGRELFPPLIVMLAMVLALELFVSNRFYREA